MSKVFQKKEQRMDGWKEGRKKDFNISVCEKPISKRCTPKRLTNVPCTREIKLELITRFKFALHLH